ncbi:hypothetical protein [Actinomadura madurae]|uniref:hypothetical protein n=1 Tax=Actinomadura madurae TaxID=1993 RepID=UPI0020D24038|nr:hypothetical protein [Actinomadura madurae]MCQ0021282.1 hypothetical protein [Actinomadura madurae]
MHRRLDLAASSGYADRCPRTNAWTRSRSRPRSSSQANSRAADRTTSPATGPVVSPSQPRTAVTLPEPP